MKNLWTVLPPLLSDNFGFMEIIRHSDGCGVIDDSGGFRIGGGHGGREKRQGEHPRGEHDGLRSGKDRKGKKGNTRVVVSGADAQDVATGTRDKLMAAFAEANQQYQPAFALFSAGPCGAMIGTDLNEIADTVSKQYHIPTAAVDLTGQKTYDVGLAQTTKVLANLFAEKGEVLPCAVNILGASKLDWADEDVVNIKAWAEKQGYHVLSQPGSTVTMEQMKGMGMAQLNLVTSVSGMATAKYLQSKLGTPYLTGAPFGSKTSKLDSAPKRYTDVLIIGEQFMANAVRSVLESRYMVSGVDVATFFQMEKSLARVSDKRIKGEDGARQLLNDPRYRIVIADPILRQLLQRDCKWIDLPHRALNTYSESKGISLLGENLNNWLDSVF